MSARAFVPDGYTEDGYISEFPNVHEAVRFKFRPALPEAVRVIMHRFDEKPAKQKGDNIDQTLMHHLVEWDLCDHEGNTLALAVENFRRIKKPLKDRLFNIVTCYDGGDSDDSKVTPDDETLDYTKLFAGEEKTDKVNEQAKN